MKKVNSSPSISVLKIQGRFLVIGSSNGSIRFYDDQYRIEAWFEDIDLGAIHTISFSNITTLLKARGQEELLGVIQSAPTEAQNVIKKVGSGPYLAWLRTSIESNEATTEKTKIETKKARLNSILPTLSPLSNSISEDTVSMKKYISFVEENIIKKYSLDSVASLSLQNITYGKKG